MRRLFFLGFLLLSLDSLAQTDSIEPSLSDSLLIEHLRSNYYPTTSRNYDAARDSMYQYLDVDESDSLTCVYSGLRAKRDDTRTPSNGALSFNTEHTWPQSFYDNNEPMRGDIHHLFTTWSSPNQSRSNHPFGEIDDNNTTSWWFWENGESVSSVPSSNIDSYSEYYSDTFEPREDHKGNAARAVFYFWTMYANNSDVVNDASDNEAFFDGMKSILYQWHQDDPVDTDEVNRSLGIESIQGNRNPFIHDTTLVRRAYFETSTSSSSEGTGSSNIFISEVYEPNGGTVKYVELYNDSDSTIDLGTDDWELWRLSNANTTHTAIDLTGSLAANSFFVIGDDNATSGVSTVFVEGLVNINNSGISHNGNDKYLLIRSASSSPDTVDSFAKDNIGNSSSFATNQVAYRVYSALPNDGSFGQTTSSSNGDTVSSGNWVVFDISSSNANARLVGTPGYNKGIESDEKPEALISGDAGWRLLSLPITNGNVTSVSDNSPVQGITSGTNASSDANFYLYTSSGAWQEPTDVNTAWGDGLGFAMYFFDTSTNGSSELPIIMDASGSEPSSDVAVSLNPAASGYTLVGNPFANNFNTNSLSATSSNISTNIALWDDASSSYSMVDRSTPTIIAPWQGFWVQTVNAQATTLTFPTSGKTTTNMSGSYFSKTQKTTADIQFSLRSVASYDEAIKLSFRQDATFGNDHYDFGKLMPLSSTYALMAFNRDGQLKSVESLPYQFDEIIELSLEPIMQEVENELTFSWNGIESIPNEWSIILHDNLTQKAINLRDYSEYSFFQHVQTNHKRSNQSLEISTVTVQSNQTESRFSLTISPSVSVSNEEDDEPISFDLGQNYPNPFNPSTQINYTIPQATHVVLEVVNSLGQTVATLVQESKRAGNHTVNFDASKLSSGVYFYTIKAGEFRSTKKMLLIK